MYKFAAGKTKNKDMLLTLRKEDGTYTKNQEETINYMIDHFAANDEEENDNNTIKQKGHNPEYGQIHQTIDHSRRKKSGTY